MSLFVIRVTGFEGPSQAVMTHAEWVEFCLRRWKVGYYIQWSVPEEDELSWGPKPKGGYVATPHLTDAALLESVIDVRIELRWMHEHHPEVQLEVLEFGAPKPRPDLAHKPKPAGKGLAKVLQKDTSHLRYGRPRWTWSDPPCAGDEDFVYSNEDWQGWG